MSGGDWLVRGQGTRFTKQLHPGDKLHARWGWKIGSEPLKVNPKSCHGP